MVYRAIKIIVANIVSMVHAYWSYRVITYIIHKTIWKNTIVKKSTHNLANIIDIQSCSLSILATDPNHTQIHIT